MPHAPLTPRRICPIEQAWSKPSFSYEGKYHRFKDVAVVPKPHQKPAPPIRIAASTPDTFPAIGAMGLPIFVAVRLGTLEELEPNIAAYRAAYRAVVGLRWRGIDGLVSWCIPPPACATNAGRRKSGPR